MEFKPTNFESDEEDEGDSVPREGCFGNQQFARIKSKCLAEKILFVDPQFPPSEYSLFASGSTRNDLEWKRPFEICDNPHLFVGGATRFDINQGELGDCWLMSAIANLTMNKKLFAHVVPRRGQHFSRDYAGIFHFRFWQYGEWVDVVVDDFLPTKNGRLIYIKSDEKNEFWSALLEKAYAKLHGSYRALSGGKTSEAMVDFSGGVGESFNLKDSPVNIFQIMLKAYQRSSMLSCSINSEKNGSGESKTPSGLVRGHAYSITKVVLANIKTGGETRIQSLIRVRNPWGDEMEWNGPWSDGSREWANITEDEKRRLGLQFDNDGEFFISLEDFLINFDGLEICHLTPDPLDGEEANEGKLQWQESLFNGSWITGSTAGGCVNNRETFPNNPQFKIVLQDSDDDDDELCTCLISLMQKGSRRKTLKSGSNGCLSIGFVIYHLSEPETTDFPLPRDFFRYHSSSARVSYTNCSARFKLSPGTYVIIPTTYKPDEEGEFLLRIFSEKSSYTKSI